MMNSVLAALIPITYRQSDIAYRLGLLREFLEFVFFTKQASRIDSEAFESFLAAGARDAGDVAVLRSLSPELYTSFQRDTFREVLDGALRDAKTLPTVRLTVAVLLPTEEVEAIGEWVRRTAGENLLLEFSVDPEIGAGCQLLWQDVLHDYSFEERLRVHQQELSTRLSGLFQPTESA